MVLVGVLTVLLAIGMRQVMPTGRGAFWAPRLLGLFGVAFLIGGVLRADPVVGFPPGTTPEVVQRTWHGAVQNASRGASTILLIATSLVIAALAAFGLAIGTNPGWVTVLAADLYRLEARRRH